MEIDTVAHDLMTPPPPPPRRHPYTPAFVEALRVEVACLQAQHPVLADALGRAQAVLLDARSCWRPTTAGITWSTATAHARPIRTMRRRFANIALVTAYIKKLASNSFQRPAGMSVSASSHCPPGATPCTQAQP